MTVKTPVYLDYAATTPVDKRVAEKMIPYLTETFGNPASNSHAFGWEAEEAVEKARADIAALINADPKEIIFTSGATESDNLAIKGAANFYKTKGKHLITVKTEHKAVLDTMRELERQGFEVTYLGVKENGLIDLEELKAAIRDDTILISVMWVNNEIGVVQDIPAIGEICRERKIIFHVDAAQACGNHFADRFHRGLCIIALRTAAGMFAGDSLPPCAVHACKTGSVVHGVPVPVATPCPARHPDDPAIPGAVRPVRHGVPHRAGNTFQP